MKILLTGVNGQVGNALSTRIKQHELLLLDRNQLDLTQPNAIAKIVTAFKPDVILNPAAYTTVDKAETEQDLAYAVNAEAPRAFAQAAEQIGAILVHFSTDYVFDGSKIAAYQETDMTNPLSIYGKSKLVGEQAIVDSGAKHFIFRTSWVYSTYGKNFLKTILRLAGEREELNIVADQFGAPTSAETLADACVDLIEKISRQENLVHGIYHMTNGGETSWHGFAQAILAEYNKFKLEKNWPVLKAVSEKIHAIQTIDYPTPAVRPKNSRLNNQKLLSELGIQLPHWQAALSDVMRQLP